MFPETHPPLCAMLPLNVATSPFKVVVDLADDAEMIALRIGKHADDAFHDADDAFHLADGATMNTSRIVTTANNAIGHRKDAIQKINTATSAREAEPLNR